MGHSNIRKFTLVFSMMIVSILACSTPSKIATSFPESTQAEQELRPATTSADIEDIITFTAETSSQGRISFPDPLTKQSVTINVADISTRKPLNNISVTILSNGTELLLFGVDPRGEYAPIIKEVQYTELSTIPDYQLAKLAAPTKITLETVLLLIAIVEIEQNFMDWWEFAQDLPDLERWGFASQDHCVTNDQTTAGIKALSGTALIFFPPFKKAFSQFTDEITVTFLTTMGDTAFGNLFIAQIEKLGLSFRPAIVKWRVYSLDGKIPYFPVRPVGWCLEPLEQSNPQSIIDWIKYGINKEHLYPFKVLALNEGVNYVNYIEGGQSISKQDFLSDLEVRLSGNPQCDGYVNADGMLQVWTSGWSPAWEMTELCYAGCQSLNPPWESNNAGFFLYPSDNGFTIKTVWINDYDKGLWEDIYHYQMVSCDQSYVSYSSPVANSTEISHDDQCPGTLPSRLRVGEYAYVSLNPPLSNRVRRGAGKNYEVIGEIPPGKVMEILDGPQCSDNWAWWNVKDITTGTIGWTAEGDNESYWLIPCKTKNDCGTN